MIQTDHHQPVDVPLPLVAHAAPIGLLLSGERSYQVPDYQRRYSWTADNARDLWDDVRMAAEEKEHHFFGTLLVVDPQQPGRPAQVIDGQQRLTTFALLLIAIDRELERFQGDGASLHVQHLADELRATIDGLLWLERNGEQIPRLQLRLLDNGFFRQLLSGYPPADNFQAAYRELSEQLRALLEVADDPLTTVSTLLEAVTQRCLVIFASCDETFDPFTLFTTLNATGLPLTATQILRARALGIAQTRDETTRTTVASAWHEVEQLEDDGDRFLQAYLAMLLGQRIAAKDLVRRFDRTVLKPLKDAPSSDIVEAHAVLQRSARLYASLAKGAWPSELPPPPDEAIETRLRYLVRELGAKQAVPLLLATALRAPSELPEVVDVVERAAFMAIVILDNQTKWGDLLFSAAQAMHDGSVSADELAQAFWSFFADRFPEGPCEAFRERLRGRLRFSGRNKSIARYLLVTLDREMFPAADTSWNLSQVRIDAVAPIGPTDGIPDETKRSVGNLVPIEQKLRPPENARLDEKRSAYAKSGFAMTRALASLTSWNERAIEEREAELLDAATAHFCRPLPL